MATGYQIYKYHEGKDECFVSAGKINWFPTLDEAKARKKALEETWGVYGVKYIIVACGGRKEF